MVAYWAITKIQKKELDHRVLIVVMRRQITMSSTLGFAVFHSYIVHADLSYLDYSHNCSYIICSVKILSNYKQHSIFEVIFM